MQKYVIVAPEYTTKLNDIDLMFPEGVVQIVAGRKPAKNRAVEQTTGLSAMAEQEMQMADVMRDHQDIVPSKTATNIVATVSKARNMQCVAVVAEAEVLDIMLQMNFDATDVKLVPTSEVDTGIHRKFNKHLTEKGELPSAGADILEVALQAIEAATGIQRLEQPRQRSAQRA